jgi:hypothetical protein
MKRSERRLTVDQVLAWADDHKDRTGRFPRVASGPVPASPANSWQAIDSALRVGLRGLPGGDSLPRLLARRRGYRNKRALPPLTEQKVLRWAKHHHKVTGSWPNSCGGAVLAAPGEDWRYVDHALREGQRGLPGGSSLARLLTRHLGRKPPTVPKGRPDSQRRRQAQELRAQGLSLTQIGERMGCTKQNVCQLLNPGRQKKKAQR